MSPSPSPSTSLVELLRAQVDRFSDKTILRFLGEREEDEATFTYADLDRRARAIAAQLQQAGAAAERVLVLHQPGLEYVAALIGCMYAGAVAVPAYPPRMNRSMERLRDIVVDARARFGLTTANALDRIRRQEQLEPELRDLLWIATDQSPDALASEWRAPTQDASAIVLLQYTSGSTSAPKGVMLSHANLISNIHSLAELRDPTIDDRFVSWLPPYHDMGLIGATLLPLIIGTEAVLLAPTTFLQRPFRWLWAITRYRGTISGGPNFAYELCTRRISAAQQEMLDLSSWRVAFSGAERVRSDTLDRFANTFGARGFRRTAFAPCYGLAEATLGVSFSSLEAAPTIFAIDEEHLNKGVALPAEEGRGTRTLVGCGKPLANSEIVIVNPERREKLAEGVVGEIWVRNQSVAQGYWGKPDLSEETFRARLKDSIAPTYLRTGDLGFLHAGELFVAGRIKDLIVLRGLNYYPEDIEHSVDSAHPRLRAGCGVAFSVDAESEERLVVVYEVDSPRDLVPDEITTAIRNAIAEDHHLLVHEILLVPPGSVPKTSSGKLQRGLSRDHYLTNVFEILGRSGAHTEAQAASDKWVSRVCQLMASLLGLESVAADDDFFWLGGHSLMATQLMSRVRDEFAVELPLRAAFEAPTPRALAARIAAAPPAQRSGPSERVDRSGPLPLSFSQERMWVLHHLDPHGSAYNVAGAATLEGALDVNALGAALNEIMRRHEVLRTNFVTVEGQPSLRIADAATVPFDIVDLQMQQDAEAAAVSLASTMAAQPFDIANELLIRAALYRIAPEAHVLCISMHHLVTDAWSLGMFVADMLRFYDAFAAGKLPPPVADTLTYVDYAHWQRKHLNDEQVQPELDFWKKQLAGAEALELATDRPRASRRSSAGALEPLPLSADLLASLAALASAERTTLFMVLLAAFETLLHRYTQRNDLVVGVPVANRNWLAAEHLMGTLVNTLALRLQFDETCTFRELLGKVREAALDAYAHQDLPFERLVSTLPVERRPGESPLVRVMFDYQNAPMPSRSEGALRMRPLMISRHASQFDLSLLILDTEFGRLARVEYSTELFDAATVRRFLQHYVAILESIALNTAAAIAMIPLLTGDERRQLLEQSVQVASEQALPLDVYASFQSQATRAPQAVAVVDAAGSCSYAEVQRKVNLLARQLRALGAGRGERVALYLERDRDLLVAVLAALEIGAAYVPLDPRHPTDRIKYVLADADARVIITKAYLRDTLPISLNAAVLALDQSAGSSIAGTGEVQTVPSASEPAYVIYTSGSTGRPKGVEVSRGSLANFLRSMSHTPGITDRDRLLSVTTVAFDIAGLELLLPVLNGASVYIASGDQVADGRQLLALMTKYRPTLMQATPATWTMLLDSGWSGSAELTILCGGEALPRELAQKLLVRCRALWNMYGPTETTIWSTLHRVSEADPVSIPIGKPIDATSIYILDAQGELAPQGVAGEIYIGGVGVANGYFRKPELTRQKFLPDPFANVAGARMYRTGDAGRRRNDGTLEYLGRFDHQIKLRGFRIEPAEIELAIKRHPQVREALVVAREDRPSDVRLVAYYIPTNADVLESTFQAQLLEDLQRSLPAYMIPTAFVALPAFPQTPNGKIDRAALPAPVIDQTESSEAFVAPRNEVEATLQRIWEEALGVPRVGVRDNFFNLGGHSLLAMRIFAAIERSFGVALPLNTLFERSTIEYLAERIHVERQALASQPRPRISLGKNEPARGSLIPIRKQGTSPPLFCVHGAGGQVLNFWAIAQHLGPHQPFYALEAPGVDGEQSPHEHIEDMARQYLAELRGLQPRGPYYLSGYCGGGWIAFEMAKRLRAEGEDVAILALLDSYGPCMPNPAPRVEQWIKGSLREGATYLLERLRGRIHRDFDAVSQALRIRYHRLVGHRVPYELRDVWLTRAFLDAAAHYRPTTYDGKITLFLAKNVTTAVRSTEMQFGWAGLARGGVEVHHVPGTHHTLTSEPHVAELVGTLLRCMRAARPPVKQ